MIVLILWEVNIGNMKKIFFIGLVLAIGCKEIYNAPVNSSGTGYLVVEGFINSTGVTTIKLSRTTKLSDGNIVVYEYNATVTIESYNGEKFLLHSEDSGTYVSDELLLNPTETYRLRIKTLNGKEYVSDYAAYKTTPAIDSITWKRDNGVQIYVNSHDATGNTKYFQWQYDETWEYHSTYQSSLKYEIDPISQLPVGIEWRDSARHLTDETLYRCWKTKPSTNILISSTEKLSSDVVYLSLFTIPSASEQLSVLYSVNVKQFAISRENYDFLQKMKKNTEQLGSIFDAQPTELKGNIHCTTDPNEIVVGYIDVSQERRKRIFISNAEVPGWNYNSGCSQIIIENNPDSIRIKGQGLFPTVPKQLNPLGGIDSFYASEIKCVDCTYEDRTNVKPSFWP